MEKIFKIVEEVFEIDKLAINENIVINEIETWNSLKHMEFIFCLEEQLGVIFSGDQIAEFRTLGDIISTIN